MNTSLKSAQYRLRSTLEANGIKVGTKKAQMAEFFFLQGALAAADKEFPSTSAAICMLSGRSILTLKNE